MAFNQKFTRHMTTRNGESVERITYFKYRGELWERQRLGKPWTKWRNCEKQRWIERERSGAVQSQSWTRVWNGIFRIHDLTKRYGAGFGKTQNILTGNGIWLLPGKRDSPKFGHVMQVFLLSVGECESTERGFSGVCYQSKRYIDLGCQ